jgi:general secretion pathway protein M
MQPGPRSSSASASDVLLQPLRERWAALQDRERYLVAAALVLVVAALLWMVAIKPAVNLLKQAPGQLDALDAQMQSMQRLAAEARELRGAPQVGINQSQAALRAASERLAPQAKLAVQGEKAVLTVDGIDGENLRAWLTEVRSGARARPIEAQLTRGANGYSGTITLAIGGAS